MTWKNARPGESINGCTTRPNCVRNFCEQVYMARTAGIDENHVREKEMHE